jgi:hypothetical protein
MRSLTIVAAIFVAIVAVGGCNVGGWGLGSGVVVEETMDVSGFTTVAASSGFAVDIQPGTDYSVTIRTDDDVMPHVLASLVDTALELSLETGYWYNATVLRATITLPTLSGLVLSGGSQAYVSAGFDSTKTFSARLSGGSHTTLQGLSTEDLALELSGGSSLNGAMACPCGDVRAVLSGGSRITALDGVANRLTVEQSGGGETDLSGLTADSANVTLSGGSRVKVNAKTGLAARLSGGSSLAYRLYEAGPAITALEISGGSSLAPF